MSAPNAGGPPPPHARNAPSPVPAVPLTLDGSSVLHQMFRIRWTAWRSLAPEKRQRITDEAAAVLKPLELHPEGGTALFSQLGHKGDLMIVHFRRSFEGLNEVELALAQLRAQRLSGSDGLLCLGRGTRPVCILCSTLRRVAKKRDRA